MGSLATALSALGVLSALINPLWGTCAFVAALVIRPNEHVEGVLFPVIPTMVIVMGLVFLLHFVYTGRRLQMPKAASNRSFLLLMVMLLILLTHLFIWRREEISDWILGEAAPAILITLFAMRFMSSPARLAAMFAALGASAAVIAGQALGIHFLRKEPMFLVKDKVGDMLVSHGALWDSYHLYQNRDEPKTYSVRLQGCRTGTWGNSNDMAMVCNWGVPVMLYYIRRKGSKLLKAIAAALMLVLMGTVFLTGSRGNQMQMGIHFWMIFVGGKRKALGIVLLLIAVVGALVILPRLSPQRSDSKASSDERTLLLEDAMRFFIHNPIKGVGFNNFPDLAFRTLMPHNVYAQCLAETGLIGASIFFPLIFFRRRETSKSIKYLETRPDFNLAMLARCIGSLEFGFFIFMLFSNQFMRFTFALVISCGMALYFAAIRKQEEEGVAEVKEEAPAEAVASQAAVYAEVDPDVVPLPPHSPLMLEAHDEGSQGARYVFDPEDPNTGVRPAGAEEEDEDEPDIEDDPWPRRGRR